ncbi:MAG: hypothetical protein J0M17_02500 [Planctomycetes bacterium]|nr:hypothetical protein [Planctomycetota bacterium]
MRSSSVSEAAGRLFDTIVMPRRFTNSQLTRSRPSQYVVNRRTVIVVCLAAFVITTSACSSTKYVKLRQAPKNPLSEQLSLAARSGPKPSDRTMQMLRRYDAVNDLKGDPQKLLTKFQGVLAREPSIELVYTVSELAYVAGKKTESDNEKVALDFYETSVAYSYMYLFDTKYGPARNPYDPQFRGSCDLYNSALESALRIVKKRGQLVPGAVHTIESANRKCDVTIALRCDTWHPDDFAGFEFVSDYEVSGLTNNYQTYGLGVPLIAVRRKHTEESPAEKYYPPDLSFPVTAFLRVVPQGTAGEGQSLPTQVELELYDPLQSTDIEVAGRRVPLESDASTALAHYLNNPELKLDELATIGLLRPDYNNEHAGLYMLQPYEPGKIPVVMIHGLWSSPLTWMEMFNDLRSDPTLRQHYQFWFYLYPTGQPFWNSATKFRDELAEMRRRIDPEHKEAALDQMVLVGHSMGGLVARLQTVESRDDYWHIVSDQPFQQLKADEAVRQQLQKVFYFEPNSSVRRVVTIGTPHHGSSFSNSTTRWLANKLIKLPSTMMMSREQIVKDNPDLIRNPKLLETKTSIDSLSPESPILPVLLQSPIAPGVVYHNIIGVVPKDGFLGRVAAGSDGVVSQESAHLEFAASEITVPADHMAVHRHPQSVMEVRRVLLVHLNEVHMNDLQPVQRAFELAAPSAELPSMFQKNSSFAAPPLARDGAEVPVKSATPKVELGSRPAPLPAAR